MKTKKNEEDNQKVCLECAHCGVAAEPYGAIRYVCKNTGKTITAPVDKLPACVDFKPEEK